MVQLTFPDCESAGALSDVIESISCRWAHEFGQGSHLTAASRATCARFSQWGSRALTDLERARVSAYFSAVVRRALTRENEAGARQARRRLVEASIVADLCAGGWTMERAVEEARSVTAGRQCGAAA
jgi:hypothetical protein